MFSFDLRSFSNGKGLELHNLYVSRITDSTDTQVTYCCLSRLFLYIFYIASTTLIEERLYKC